MSRSPFISGPGAGGIPPRPEREEIPRRPKHYGSLPKSLTTCTNCKQGKCEECVDVLRSVYTDDMICTCTRKNHSGEPAASQVADPFDGSVHGPGLVVSEDGEVSVDPEFRRKFIEQFDGE